MSQALKIRDELQALRRGEVDIDAVTGRIKLQLVQSLESADDILQAIEDAYHEDLIDPKNFSLLRAFIVDTVTTHGGRAPPLDVDLSTKVESVGFTQKTTELASTDAIVTSPPGGVSEEVSVGSRLRNRFILDEVLGVGGMGTVYRGRDILKLEARDRNPYVAIKVLNESFKTRPDAFIALQREASRQQRLAHPNIATVYDFDKAESTMFITMELLEGTPLDEFIKTKVRPANGLSMKEALPVLEGLGAALEYAHQRNIVHADFKPSNCFLTRNGQVKVLDFGIARAMKDPSLPDRQETLFDGRKLGAMTPAYASLEMLKGSALADPRDDIYALGCVGYELLTGRHPFNRVRADEAMDHGMMPGRIKQLSRKQNDALAKSLAFTRDARTANVEEFLNGIREARSFKMGWKIPSAAAGLLLALGAALFLPGYLERSRTERLLTALSSDKEATVAEAVGRIPSLPSDIKRQVLHDGKDAIIDFYTGRFEDLFGTRDSEAPFAEMQELLAAAESLYSDSATLHELQRRLTERKERYLGALAQSFEDYLAMGRLLQTGSEEDLRGVLAELRRVDPQHPLLTDKRLPWAYAEAAEDALANGNFDRTRTLLDAGWAISPDAAALQDVRDRLVRAEQEVARQERIALLENQLLRIAGEISDLDDLENLDDPVAAMNRLDSENAVLETVGQRVREQIDQPLQAIADSRDVAALEAFDRRFAPMLAALGLTEVNETIDGRKQVLRSRQNELLADARRALKEADMRAPDGQTLGELIGELRDIDPREPRLAELMTDTVREYRGRAAERVRAEQWTEARAQLVAAINLNLSRSLEEAVREDIKNVAQMQRQAAQRRAAEQQRAEAEQQREMIADAETALTQSMTGLSPSAEALAAVQERMDALAALQPDHPLLAETSSRVADKVADAALAEAEGGRFAEGLALLRDADRLGFDRTVLEPAREEIGRRRTAAQETARLLAVQEATGALDELLKDVAELSRAGRQQEIAAALGKVTATAGDDRSVVRQARQRIADAFLAASERLIAEQRFTAARQLLDQAAAYDADPKRAAETAHALESAEGRYRVEREAQELAARVSAGRQRFMHELKSRQLDKAANTLRDLQAIAPASDAFATRDAPGQLVVAYADKGRADLEAGRFKAASDAVSAGLALRPDDERLSALGRDIEIGRVGHQIQQWFAGQQRGTPADVRRQIADYRRLDPQGFKDREARWGAAASERLAALREDRDAHNAFLQTAKDLLPGSATLARIEEIAPPPPPPSPRAKPEPPVVVEEPAATQPPATAAARPRAPRREPEIPAPVALAAADLLGEWCGSGVNLIFTENSFAFVLGDREISYPVTHYAAAGDVMTVHWTDKEHGAMITEFGEFSDERSEMVQIRGKTADAATWQDYGRRFTRCR